MTVLQFHSDHFLSLLVAGAIALPAVPAAAGAEAGIDGARLESLLLQDCGACHGGSLKGGLGRPLLPEALAGLGAETIASIILDGIPGTPMPPWRPLLSAGEADWLARRLLKGARP